MEKLFAYLICGLICLAVFVTVFCDMLETFLICVEQFFKKKEVG